MRITDLQTVRRDGQTIVRAMLAPDRAGSPPDLWFRFDGIDGPPDHAADAVTAAMLPSCMFDAETCQVDAALSPAAHVNFAKAQEILAGWYDFLTPVRIDSPVAATTEEARSPGVACCFSGGVDSWYSLLKHRKRVSHLLLVRGFDIGLGNDRLWHAAHAQASRLAVQLGKRLIVCQTNLRTVADRRRATWGRPFDGDFWGRCLHGAALAACVLALGRTIGELIVPATHQLNGLKPWGSSPMLDPLWSNHRVTISHDGCEADRFAKIRAIATCDLALASLRVCYNDTDLLNCGACEKCVRTMLALRLCGAFDRAPTFPHHRAFARIRRLDVPSHLRHHYETMLVQARCGGDRAIAHEIETILGRRFSVERTVAQSVRRMRRARRTFRSHLQATPRQ